MAGKKGKKAGAAVQKKESVAETKRAAKKSKDSLSSEVLLFLYFLCFMFYVLCFIVE